MTRSVLVLAGGRSRRLGRDKAWVEVGGAPVLARVLRAARAALDSQDPDLLVSVANAALIAGRFASDPEDRFSGVRLIEDQVPGAGPVGGLAGGIAAARGSSVVVLAADLPFVGSVLIEALFEALDAAPSVDGVVPVVGGREQPLCAAYRSSVAVEAARLMAAVQTSANGGSEDGPPGPSVASLLAALDMKRVETFEGLTAKTLAVQCRGIDTPADLDWANALAVDHG